MGEEDEERDDVRGKLSAPYHNEWNKFCFSTRHKGKQGEEEERRTEEWIRIVK